MEVSRQGLVRSQDIKSPIPTQEIIIATLARKLSRCFKGVSNPRLALSLHFSIFPTCPTLSSPVSAHPPSATPELELHPGQSAQPSLFLLFDG